jgi:hypothetical protein
MNWRGSRRKRLLLKFEILCTIPACLDALEKIVRNLRTAGLGAKILYRDLRNTKQERYLFIRDVRTNIPEAS